MICLCKHQIQRETLSSVSPTHQNHKRREVKLVCKAADRKAQDDTDRDRTGLQSPTSACHTLIFATHSRRLHNSAFAER